MIHFKLHSYLVASLFSGCCLWFAACSEDPGLPVEITDPIEVPSDDGKIVIEIPAGGLQIPRCKVLSITPILAGEETYEMQWSIGDSVISSQKELEFIALNPGQYSITLQATNSEQKKSTLNFTVTVKQEEKNYSPYITSIPEYKPAPGQFVNELPKYEEGDTQRAINQKVLEAIGYNTRGMITLGGYGGYVICGFDHTIVNVPGQYDLKILGNAFHANANPNPEAPEEGGSCEPGIVMVAYDRNKNGIADTDEWYELAGSEYTKETTLKNYQITYYRPDEYHEPVEAPEDEQSWNTDAEYIAWQDNRSMQGFMPKNIYHRQDYYPKWLEENELSFKGILLPNNAKDESGEGKYWVLYAYPWGYADNGLNVDETSNFNIEWAVDAEGNPVHLPGIDFVKIYTGVNQYCGWLGETSTEVMGINDLHLLNN
jgi:hypothetical protein